MKLGFSLFSIFIGFFAAQAIAEPYWVLGSYLKEDNAISQQAYMHDLIGKPISRARFDLEGQTYFRLLLADSLYTDNARMSLQAERIKPWKTNGPTNKPINTLPPSFENKTLEIPVRENEVDTPTKSFYVVAGSYTEVTEALEVESRLEKFFEQTSSQTLIVKGQVYHRVVIGPVSRDSTIKVRDLLETQGLNQTWLLNAENEIARDSDGTDKQEAIETVRSVPANLYRAKKQITPRRSSKGGYNLAKLGPKFSPTYPE